MYDQQGRFVPAAPPVRPCIICGKECMLAAQKCEKCGRPLHAGCAITGTMRCLFCFAEAAQPPGVTKD